MTLPSGRPPQRLQGSCHCGAVRFCRGCGIDPFHRRRVTPDPCGIIVFCPEGFDPVGIPVRATRAIAMD